MVATSSQVRIPDGEQRVVFFDVSWENYLQIFRALPDGRGSRLCYESGTLEISMPSQSHEFFARLIELFIRILVTETGLKIKTMGSTTMNFDELEKGMEPDCAYYIQNHALVSGREVDFAADPPPDLVVEVDITHSDIDKNRLYAAIGVPEFWRYNGEVWRIFCLEDGAYRERDRSATFPIAEKRDLYEFLAAANGDEVAAEQAFRAALRDRVGER